MLKKIVLVAALAVASFVSVNLAAHTQARPTPAPQPVAAKFPPCDPWMGGAGCALEVTR
jgi:hypothetical protein